MGINNKIREIFTRFYNDTPPLSSPALALIILKRIFFVQTDQNIKLNCKPKSHL